ncbi:hypothetical protein ACFLSI_00310 [Bacteroidota bacterium]
MKIAIPTNDGINISNNFFNTLSFKIFTVEKGNIIDEEMRTYNDKHTTTLEKKIDFISDCDVYIIDNKDSIANKLMTEKEKAIEKTGDSIITNIIVDFKNEQQRIESNTICCP